MKFYAYIPTKDGREPLGSSGRLMFELKTVAGGHRYTNFYNDKTFREV